MQKKNIHDFRYVTRITPLAGREKCRRRCRNRRHDAQIKHRFHYSGSSRNWSENGHEIARKNARPNGAVHRAMRRFHYSRLLVTGQKPHTGKQDRKGETKRRSARCTAPFPLFKVYGTVNCALRRLNCSRLLRYW